ncbi:hypothetical protein H0H87_012117 [Tephrocybe sp. NHM501043]|nr:hypothetical protein H0H87_012117 [Tephrocybe sp. NHM501043]
MTIEDIVVTLKELGWISIREATPPPVKPLPGQSIKINKGRKSNVARRHLQRAQTTTPAASETPKGPFVTPTEYMVAWNRDNVSQRLQTSDAKGYLRLKPEKLTWSPYVLTRRDKVEKVAHEQSQITSAAGPEVEESTLAIDVSKGPSPAPEVVPFPSPMNMFDDDEAVEEVPRPPPERRMSRSKSPLPPLNEIPVTPRKPASRKRKHDASSPPANEPRSTRGRPRETSKDEGAAAIKHGVDIPRPGRSLRSRPSEPGKRATSSPVTMKSRKRARAESTDVEVNDTIVVTEPPPHMSGLPNGNHTEELLSQEGDGRVVPVREGVKAEDGGTSLTNHAGRQSDDTILTTTALNGKGDVVVAIDEEDADAEGEDEEDAEGEPDEDTDLEQNMQYGRMQPQERRDSNLDSNGSVNQAFKSKRHNPDQLALQTPYQTHQSLGQALGSHIPGFPLHKHALDTPLNSSTQGLAQNGPQQTHPGPPPSHSPLFTVTTGHPSPGMKRKQVDSAMNAQVLKRRRDADDGDSFDIDGTGQGAKHWTDEEKSKLFNWLMGPGQDDHWNSLRATKNSCLRECANEVFGSKKTYQALKGCYERNFNLFKQIYAYELYHAHAQNLSSFNEADRLREYERRLQSARKAGCDVGNVTARTIDHWHRLGWYDLFYRRWHGDPATTRPVQTRTSNANGSNMNGGDDSIDLDDDPPQINFPDPTSMMPNGINTNVSHDRPHPPPQNPLNYINPQTLREPVVSHTAASPIAGSSGSSQQASNPIPISPMPSSSSTSAAPSSSEPVVVNMTVTQSMLSAYMQYLQVQTQSAKMKLEYMRRREEREEKDSAHRREVDRLRLEREAVEFEHNKQKSRQDEMTNRAMSLLENPNNDLRKAAGDYLKNLFEGKT